PTPNMEPSMASAELKRRMKNEAELTESRGTNPEAPPASCPPEEVGAAKAESKEESPRILGANWAVRWAFKYGYRMVRRVVIAVVGFSVLLVGLVMAIGPGPAVIVIPLGLAILALEFRWAGRLLRYARQQLQAGIQELARRTGMSADSRGDGESNHK
ncbi:MAG: hypothetical protein GYA33_14335, partial [Thermogutta sp.]|nr:hypothetical protein [Thermogutta sp.]